MAVNCRWTWRLKILIFVIFTGSIILRIRPEIFLTPFYLQVSRLTDLFHRMQGDESLKQSRNQIIEQLLLENGKIIQEKRKQKIRELCTQYNYLRDHPYRMRVTENNGAVNIGFCDQPKSASTTILGIMLEWMGLIGTLETTDEIRAKAMDFIPVIKERTKNVSKTEQLQFTMTFVRHPLVKLVSAYRDKVILGLLARKLPSNWPRSRFMIPIDHKQDMEEDEIHKTLSEEQKTKQPTFRQFAALVAHQINLCYTKQYNEVTLSCIRRVNPHWQPQFFRCNPCGQVEFDFIGKLDQHSTDINYLLLELGLLPKSSNFKNAFKDVFAKQVQMHTITGSQSNSLSASTTATAARAYISRMSQKELDDIINAYKTDFLLFDYDQYLAPDEV